MAGGRATWTSADLTMVAVATTGSTKAMMRAGAIAAGVVSRTLTPGQHAPGREPGTRELPSARRQRPRANSQAAGKLPVAGARDGASSASKLQKDQVHGKSSGQQENANEKKSGRLTAPACTSSFQRAMVLPGRKSRAHFRIRHQD